MFTGIVQDVGRIERVTPQGDGARLRVRAQTLALDDVGQGDSIAVNGCCLTVIEKESDACVLGFDVSGETLRCTAGFPPGSSVNLEKALRLADRLGGHLVTGHVDGVGVVHAFAPVVSNADEPASWRLAIDAPHELARFIAAKGSIAMNGVSLTVNTVDGARFEVNLIPHTLTVTTLRELAPGSRVNVEVDVVARYVLRMLDATAQEA